MVARTLAVVITLAAMMAAADGQSSANHSAAAPVAVPAPAAAGPSSTAVRAEGEKRFRTNCGRCHMPPHKFPPKMMATIVRHMRVRALITDEDMRYILAYMTQ